MKMDELNKRIWLKGLVLECPMGKALSDCPLNGMRNLPGSQINTTINGLSDEKVDTIIKVHKHCFKHRLQSISHPMQ
jgi:hypothetical protein